MTLRVSLRRRELPAEVEHERPLLRDLRVVDARADGVVAVAAQRPDLRARERRGQPRDTVPEAPAPLLPSSSSSSMSSSMSSSLSSS